MSEENVATPAIEHASIGENGAIILSEEALAAMDNVQPPDDETPEAEETPIEATPAPIVEAPVSKKIKHNGQEVEVPADKEIEYLQKGYDYDFKLAQIDAERTKLAAYNGMVQAIETSPAIRQKVSEALGYQPPQAAPEVPQFDDPIEQLKYETIQATLKAVQEQYIAPMQAQTQQSAHMQHLNSVRQQVQADPQFQEVQTAIMDQIKALPESVGKNLYLQLDQDPNAYIEMFKTVKARLKPTEPQTTPQSEAPQPTKRETKAPLLETGNTPPPDPSEQQKQQERIKDLTKRSKAGDYRATGELMSLMA